MNTLKDVIAWKAVDSTAVRLANILRGDHLRGRVAQTNREQSSEGTYAIKRTLAGVCFTNTTEHLALVLMTRVRLAAVLNVNVSTVKVTITDHATRSDALTVAWRHTSA